MQDGRISMREAGQLLGVSRYRVRESFFWRRRGVRVYREKQRVFLSRSDVEELARIRSGRERGTDRYALG